MTRSLPLALAAAAAAALAPSARADDVLRLLDPATCAPQTKKVAEVVEETWTHVAYRTTKSGPIERVETRFVVDVDRSDQQATALRAALADLRAGNLEAARNALAGMGGGGRRMNNETGVVAFQPFPGDTKPKWYTPYVIYHYALASYREGVAKGDKALVEDALRVLDADKGDEKGFLVRFKDGKSRWYGDAWALKGAAQIALGQHDAAAATLDALYQKAITSPVPARLAYEAKVGPGRIAEAKGQPDAAEAAYEAATAALLSLLEQARDPCTRAELGRLFNEARMQKARVLLAAAEKAGSAAAYERLGAYLQEGSPEALRAKLRAKPPEVVDPAVAGALEPSVQAVGQNGIGLAHLASKRYADAIAAFTQVRVKHFAARDEVPRALYYLAQAATAAAGAAAKPEAKTLYQAQAASARAELATARWKDSEYAKKAAGER